MRLLLECFDKDFVKVGMFSKFSSITFKDMLNDECSFTLKLPRQKDIVELRNKTKYILITKTFFAEILYAKKDETENENLLELKGYKINHILRYRVCYPSVTLKADAVTNIRTLINKHFIQSAEKRKISMLRLESNPPTMTEKFEIVADKKEVYERVNEICKYKNIGYEIIPIQTQYDDESKKPTNISNLEFRTIVGKDRSFNNEQGNDPVVFERALNNLLSSEYEYNSLKSKNVCYIEGEPDKDDSGNITKQYIEEAGSTTSSGLDRREVYFDSTDAKKNDDENNPIPEDQYRKNLRTDGEQQLVEYRDITEYSGEVNTEAGIFKYEKDFEKGDIITVRDRELGLFQNTLVTGCQWTVSRTGTHLDLFLDYDYLNRSIETGTEQLNIETYETKVVFEEVVKEIEVKKGDEYEWLS